MIFLILYVGVDVYVTNFGIFFMCREVVRVVIYHGKLWVAKLLFKFLGKIRKIKC